MIEPGFTFTEISKSYMDGFPTLTTPNRDPPWYALGNNFSHFIRTDAEYGEEYCNASFWVPPSSSKPFVMLPGVWMIRCASKLRCEEACCLREIEKRGFGGVLFLVPRNWGFFLATMPCQNFEEFHDIDLSLVFAEFPDMLDKDMVGPLLNIQMGAFCLPASTSALGLPFNEPLGAGVDPTKCQQVQLTTVQGEGGENIEMVRGVPIQFGYRLLGAMYALIGFLTIYCMAKNKKPNLLMLGLFYQLLECVYLVFRFSTVFYLAQGSGFISLEAGLMTVFTGNAPAYASSIVMAWLWTEVTLTRKPTIKVQRLLHISVALSSAGAYAGFMAAFVHVASVYEKDDFADQFNTVTNIVNYFGLSLGVLFGASSLYAIILIAVAASKSSNATLISALKRLVPFVILQGIFGIIGPVMDMYWTEFWPACFPNAALATPGPAANPPTSTGGRPGTVCEPRPFPGAPDNTILTNVWQLLRQWVQVFGTAGQAGVLFRMCFSSSSSSSSSSTAPCG